MELNGVSGPAQVEEPQVVEVDAANYDAGLASAWTALLAAHARAGIQLPPGEVSRVARRFSLSGAQVADLELRGEAEGLLEAVAPAISQSRIGSDSLAADESEPDLDLLNLFRNDVGKIQWLKYADEVAFGDAIVAGARADESLRNPDISGDQIERLTVTSRRGHAASDEFWRCNTPLALHIALRFQGMGLDYLDVVQSGLMGLMKAVEKWDPHRGYRFTTYAYYWIQQSIRRALDVQGRTIRLPVHIIGTLRRIRKARRELSAHIGREPHLEELADLLGIDRAKIALLIDLEAETLSIDLAVGDSENSTIAEFVAAERNSDDDPELRIIADERLKVLNGHLATLTSRQRQVISLRFGLGNEQLPQTLQEIGDLLGVTRERVRQIEAIALRRLRIRMTNKIDRELFVS